MKGKILVADDLECSRGILRLLLRHDYDVVEAADGFEAVDALKRFGAAIVCVLLDIRMPGMDGYGVMDCVRDAGLAEAKRKEIEIELDKGRALIEEADDLRQSAKKQVDDFIHILSSIQQIQTQTNLQMIRG